MDVSLKVFGVLACVLALVLFACGDDAGSDTNGDNGNNDNDGDAQEQAAKEFERKLAIDRSNLQELMEAFIVGQAQSKPVPGSTGWQFWLALYVGDEPGGTVQVTGHDDERIYLPASKAHLLRSPFDDQVRSVEEIKSAINQAIDDQTGVAAFDSTYVSYAGPMGTGSNNSPRVALLTQRNTSGIVGTTGSRGGIGFIENGFHAVDQNGNVQFFSYEFLAEEHGYPSDAKAPIYEEGFLEWVESFEGS